MPHDNRIRLRAGFGNLVLDVHLSDTNPAVLRRCVVPADEEVTLFGQYEAFTVVERGLRRVRTCRQDYDGNQRDHAHEPTHSICSWGCGRVLWGESRLTRTGHRRMVASQCDRSQVGQEALI